jgi:hypothetical protein
MTSLRQSGFVFNASPKEVDFVAVSILIGGAEPLPCIFLTATKIYKKHKFLFFILLHLFAAILPAAYYL